jgi:HD superfamily phosphohydrolase
MFKSVLEVLINILILFIISILISIYFFSNLEDNNFNDCTELEAEFNITNSLQEEFNKFLSLFRKNNSSKNFVLEKKSNSNLKELQVTMDNEPLDNNYNSIILKEVYDLHLKSIVNENNDLQKRISMLEIEILNQKIDRLNTLKVCNDLTKDLNKELDIIKNRNSI